MKNRGRESISNTIVHCVKDVPYFTIDNLKILQVKDYHLKIVLSRMVKSGKIIRLKKGMYVSSDFLDKVKIDSNFSYYVEFIGTKICYPSYLSMDYVLYEHNVLTEIPRNFTFVSINKPYVYRNKLGVFIYHKIKDDFFEGYYVKKIGDFLIYKAEKAKALFDFLYFRKKFLMNEKGVEELRLNIEVFSKNDIRRFKEYVEKEGSKKMSEIYKYIFGL